MDVLTKKEYREAQISAAKMIRKSGIKITEEEIEEIEVVDFGLSNLTKEGIQVLTLVSTERIAVKVLVLFPNQTEPEHWHPPLGEDPGKEETIRVIDGTLRFYIPGEENFKEGFIPDEKKFYTVKHEIILNTGDQITIVPGTKHWFQAGPEGSVMYCFSSCSRDALDKFTNPNIKRITKIVE